MKKVINPELLLILGFMIFKLSPVVLGRGPVVNMVGIFGFLLLMLGAAGITRRVRSPYILFIVGASMLLGALACNKLLDLSLEGLLRDIGSTGGLLIWIAVIASWATSLIRARRDKKTKKK